MTRVAALYDIHGNLPALEAVLAELPDHGIDAVVIGGDVVWGPMPSETLARLRALEGEVHWVRGNADREVAAADVAAAPGSDDLIDRITHWVARQLTDDERTFLGSLPDTVTVEVEGLGGVLFCHGSPRSDEEIVTALTPDEVVAEILSGVAEHLVVGGHTHAQFDRAIGGKRWVNAGSLGMPFAREPGAYWTRLGPEVVPVRTGYDVDAAAERFAASGAPEVQRLAGSLAHPPDPEASARQHESRADRRRGYHEARSKNETIRRANT